MRSKKPKIELWLNIANLLLTAIVGIVIAIYINLRNEKLQVSLLEMQAGIDKQALENQQSFEEKMLELQEQINQQYEIAKLEIERNCYDVRCSGNFNIKNTGYAAAKDLKISIYISDLSVPWRGTINSIDQFNIRISPLSLNNSTESQLANTGGSREITGNNLKHLKIETLPPQSFVSVLVSLGDDVQIQDGTNYATPLFFLNDPYHYYLWSIPMQDYFWDKYSVAKLVVSATCSNCSGILESSDYQVSALLRWGAPDLKFEETSEGYSSATGHFWFDYVYPSDGKDYAIDYPEHILIDIGENADYTISESDK